MKKLVSLLLALVLLTAALPAAMADEDIKLTYWSSTILETPEGAFEQQVIDGFNALDNGITVEVVGVTSADLVTKATSGATTGELPDFTMGTPSVFSTLYDLEAVVPLEETAIDAEFLSTFTDMSREAFKGEDGNHYGVPFFMNPYGVVYRIDLFEEAGIEVPKTWDEFVQACQTLTHDGKYGMAMVGVRNTSGEARFQYLARMFGVREFYQDENGQWATDLNGEAFATALKNFADLNLTYQVCQPGALETAYPDAVKLLSSGTCAILITGSNALGAILKQAPELEGKLGSFMLPASENGAIAYSGFGFFVTTKDAEKQAAISQLVQYWLSVENQISFAAQSGRLPTRKDALSDPSIQEIVGLKGYLETLDHLIYAPTIYGYSEINDIYGEAYSSLMAGEVTLEEAVNAAYERAQLIVEEANAQ